MKKLLLAVGLVATSAAFAEIAQPVAVPAEEVSATVEEVRTPAVAKNDTTTKAPVQAPATTTETKQA